MSYGLSYDVHARLAQGGPAVEDFGLYLDAVESLCGAAELSGPRLAGMYRAEQGMDLRALEFDAAALRAAASVAAQAAGLQDDLAGALGGAWSGLGSDAAREFLRRHEAASQQAVAMLRAAADVLVRLRDTLWRAVDGKVAAVLELQAQQAAVRPAWVVAARTVTTGIGDLPAASEVVDLQVRPFVQTGIGVVLLAELDGAAARIRSALQEAAQALTGTAARIPVFEAPGELGPVWQEPADLGPARGGRDWAAPAVPAEPVLSGLPAAEPARSGMPPVTPTGGPAAPSAAEQAPVYTATNPQAAAPSAPAAPLSSPTVPPASMAPGSVPDLGLTGFGRQVADTMTGLGGAAAGPSMAPEVPELRPSGVTDERGPAQDDEEGGETGEQESAGVDERGEGEESDGGPPEPAGAAQDQDQDQDEDQDEDEDEDEDEDATQPPDHDAPAPPAEPAPTPPPGPLVPAPPLPAELAADGSTPCEIAAEELPQVGE